MHDWFLVKIRSSLLRKNYKLTRQITYHIIVSLIKPWHRNSTANILYSKHLELLLLLLPREFKRKRKKRSIPDHKENQLKQIRTSKFCPKTPLSSFPKIQKNCHITFYVSITFNNNTITQSPLSCNLTSLIQLLLKNKWRT